MTYTVAWGVDPDSDTGQHAAIVATPSELDAVLDNITTEAAESGRPYLVDIYPADWTGFVPPGLQLGLGHQDRASLAYADEQHSAFAFDPALPALAEPLGFDCGGEWTELAPERVRVAAAAVRDAAREYVRTGKRPANLSWQD